MSLTRHPTSESLYGLANRRFACGALVFILFVTHLILIFIRSALRLGEYFWTENFQNHRSHERAIWEYAESNRISNINELGACNLSPRILLNPKITYTINSRMMPIFTSVPIYSPLTYEFGISVKVRVLQSRMRLLERHAHSHDSTIQGLSSDWRSSCRISYVRLFQVYMLRQIITHFMILENIFHNNFSQMSRCIP